MKRTLMSTMIRWIAAFTVAVFVMEIYFSRQSEREWQAYSSAHHCKVTGKIFGQNVAGFAGGNAVSIFTSDRTTYICDEGVTVTR